ncbi:aminotransferase class IV [Pseudodesulfovibrio senegalensis]|uniref:Aminotransferase class IV n=1 Tax=Pseudodesulfovibrio senegalensis TaxID=1721087 RepID=A0A6N6MZX7_9BACT|nr:aminotransferase class IV [Pseudodesulfovibrio senegalensis]KAB1440819.1 aminotransferase class IV [Pseudodesulfovibrio senegalensis]
MTHFYNNRYAKGGVPLETYSPAFRFGTGFFETLLYNGKRLMHCDRHVGRIHASLDHFCIPYESVPFEEVCFLLLEKNGLTGSPARVNIFYPVAGEVTRPVVTAAAYTPDPERTYRLNVCPDRHVSTLNVHKTMAYMFFNQAHAQAVAQGFDDALLLDFSDEVLETTTASLLFSKDGQLYETDTPYKLPSLALEIAREHLDIEPRPVALAELSVMDHAYALNSLVGMRPVRRIGHVEYALDEQSCGGVTAAVCGRTGG